MALSLYHVMGSHEANLSAEEPNVLLVQRVL